MKTMLLTEYSEPSGKVFIQPKLNGIFCRIDTAFGDMFTKSGNRIKGFEYLAEKYIGHTERYIDGEIYVHGLSWSEIYSKFQKKSNDLQFHPFDVANKNRFSERAKHAEIPTYLIDSSEIIKYHKQFIADGYEGSVIRNPDGRYIEGRSTDNMKLKDYYDFEATCYTGNTLETENGLYFDVKDSDIEFDDDDILTVKCDGIGTGGLPINPVVIKNHGKSI